MIEMSRARIGIEADYFEQADHLACASSNQLGNIKITKIKLPLAQ